MLWMLDTSVLGAESSPTNAPSRLLRSCTVYPTHARHYNISSLCGLLHGLAKDELKRILQLAEDDHFEIFGGGYSYTQTGCSGWMPQFYFQCNGGSRMEIISVGESFPDSVQCTADLISLECSIPPGVSGLPINVGYPVVFACIGQAGTQISASVFGNSINWICPALATVVQSVFLAGTNDNTGKPDYSQSICTSGLTIELEQSSVACQAKGECFFEGSCQLATGPVSITATATTTSTVMNDFCPYCFANGNIESTSTDCLDNGQNNIAPRLGMARESDICRLFQANHVYTCGCSTSPERRTDPLCTICPDGRAPPLGDTVVQLGSELLLRQPTCKELDISLSYASAESLKQTDGRTSCLHFQNDFADVCGCSSSISVTNNDKGNDATEPTTDSSGSSAYATRNGALHYRIFWYLAVMIVAVVG